MSTSSRKTDQSSLIISLVILGVSFIGVIVLLSFCSEWYRRRLFRHVQIPDENNENNDEPPQPSVPSSQNSSPIPIPAAAARPSHILGDGEWTDSSEEGAGSSRQRSDSETGPDLETPETALVPAPKSSSETSSSDNSVPWEYFPVRPRHGP